VQEDIDRVLISPEQIAHRVGELARQITADHPARDGDAEITILPVLTGAMIFCGDLIRQLPMRMRIGLLAVSSYPGRSIASQGPSLLAQQTRHVRDRHVLIVDDILDSGSTVRFVQRELAGQQPASVRTCVLLRKDRPEARQTHVDYVGFDIPDEFVVGYGLDFNDYYRNLPAIVTLKKHLLPG